MEQRQEDDYLIDYITAAASDDGHRSRALSAAWGLREHSRAQGHKAMPLPLLRALCVEALRRSKEKK